MAKAMGLIFSLFDVTLAQEMSATCTMHSSWTKLPVSSFVSHLSLLTVKSVDLAVAHDGFPL